MLGLWSIDWSKLNNQITELNPENFGMGSLENTLMMNGGGGAVQLMKRIESKLIKRIESMEAKIDTLLQSKGIKSAEA